LKEESKNFAEKKVSALYTKGGKEINSPDQKHKIKGPQMLR
jgi:hypothetical protein